MKKLNSVQPAVCDAGGGGENIYSWEGPNRFTVGRHLRKRVHSGDKEINSNRWPWQPRSSPMLTSSQMFAAFAQYNIMFKGNNYLLIHGVRFKGGFSHVLTGGIKWMN